MDWKSSQIRTIQEMYNETAIDTTDCRMYCDHWGRIGKTTNKARTDRSEGM